MKLKFKQQDFQTDAVNSVVDLFIGQEKNKATFSIINENSAPMLYEGEFGVGNAQLITDETLIQNMNVVQKRNLLPITNHLDGKQFSIEMETGTGKTYVYTKTIFEMNRKYGFTKFIIVVPSVAIREGVYKSLEVTKEHFMVEYNNVPHRYFIYDSKKLSDVREFATSSNIEIMIINIDAFKKSENIINRENDKLGGITAMSFIRDTNPIVIIDEPQSVDNTPKSKEAIASLNPLCVLRYSATHKEKVNLLYQLTPVDAYQKGLVKQIFVASNEVTNSFNKAYIRLVSVSNDHGFKAKVEIDIKSKTGDIKRKIITIKTGDDLFKLSGERDMYNGYILEGIDCTENFESITFTNTEYIKLGESVGSIDENVMRKAQIKRTVEVHLEKELRYLDQNIKVLSLFFIDKVSKYRGEDGDLGIYGKMFEECYLELINRPKYSKLKERFTSSVKELHNGYFSQDKKGNLKDTKGDSQADDSTYNTIMKDKEWLLNFKCPLRFIFSHSALKEGWDNPNVFQVCTLIDQKSTFTSRQKIGRGLRLCVNQDGERIEDRNINVLHVMANESFSEFASNLQKEIEGETGIKFGVLDIGMFIGIDYKEVEKEEKIISEKDAENMIAYLESNTNKENLDFSLHKELIPMKNIIETLINEEDVIENAFSLVGQKYDCEIIKEKVTSHEDAQSILKHFEKEGYIDKSLNIKKPMVEAISKGTLSVPEQFKTAKVALESIVKKSDLKIPISDANKEVIVRLKKEVLLSEDFLALWDKIKQKTIYRINVDTDKLIKQCSDKIKTMEEIPKAKIISRTFSLDIKESGIDNTEKEFRLQNIQDDSYKLPDILLVLQEECGIPLPLAKNILINSGRLKDFVNNPQLFIQKATSIINNEIYKMEVDGISYIKLENQEYYAQEIFDNEELIANLEKNAIAVSNSVYDHIIYDSETVEKPFAIALDNDPDVKMYFKIPNKFRINTPIGTYNPDWAVYLKENDEDKLYFVLETKGSTNELDLREKENMKIKCGKKHFKSFDNNIELQQVNNWKDFRTQK